LNTNKPCHTLLRGARIKKGTRILFLLTFLLFAHFWAHAQQPKPQWVDDLKGTSGTSAATYVAVDKQNNVYVTGNFQGTVDFDPSSGVKNLTSAGSDDIFIGKYKQDGTLIWAESIGDVGYDASVGLAVDKDGNISIVGNTFSPHLDVDPGPGIDTISNPFNQNDLFLIHLDTNGNFLWANPFVIKGNGNLPTSGNIFRVASDSQDNVIITFQFSNSLTIGDTTYSIQIASQGLIVKYNAAGTELWAINIGDGFSADVGTFAVKVDSQDNIIVSGIFGATVNFNPLGTAYNLTAANSNFVASYVAKYSPTGILSWVNPINYPSNTFTADTSSAISIDRQNNVYFATAFTGSATIGSTTLNATGSGNNVCIAKYSPAGVLQFAKSIGGTGSLAKDNEMAADTANNIYLTGNFNGTVNFNTNTGTAKNLTANGPQDFYVAKYDALGNYIYAFNAGSASCSNTSGNSIAIDGNNNADVAGAFCSTVNFDQSGCSTDNVTAGSASDPFVVQYGAGTINNNVITPPAITGFCTTGTPGAITGSLPTGGSNYTYQWQSSADSVTFVNINGATGQNYTPPAISATIYYQRVVSSSGSGCSAAAPSASNVVTLTIATAPAVPVVPGDTTCAGSVATLSVTSPVQGVTYNWYATATTDTSLFTGTSFTTPALAAPTTYYVSATNSTGCTSATRDTVAVNILPVLPAPVVTVATTTPSSVTFSWAAVPGATGYEVSTDNGETYTTVSSGPSGLTDSVGGLKSGQSVTILVKAIGSTSCQISAASAAVTGQVLTGDVVYVANAFTPNGDGRNDVLHVLGQNIQTLKFYIYDQWGEQIFSTTSAQNGWDGTYKGTKEPVGVYVYYLEAVMNDGTSVKKKGTVTLLK
jgi:gliding motility-associated-like protein